MLKYVHVQIIRYAIDASKIDAIHIIDPNDNWLEKRIKIECEKGNINLHVHENPSFLTKKDELEPFFRADKKKFFQTTFYKAQRLKFNLLMDEQNKPEGGKWTYDDQNRLKFPKNKETPHINFPNTPINHLESVNYVELHFSQNPGVLQDKTLYPTDFKTARL